MTAAAQPPHLRLTTLGAVELSAVEPGGEARTLVGAGKPTALLAYLAAAPQRTASRDTFIDLIWSSAEPGAARRNLRHTSFRRCLVIIAEDALVSDGHNLRLAIPR